MSRAARAAAARIDDLYRAIHECDLGEGIGAEYRRRWEALRAAGRPAPARRALREMVAAIVDGASACPAGLPAGRQDRQDEGGQEGRTVDLAEATGKDWKEFVIGGLPWRVAPLRLDEWAETQAHIKAHLPNPVTRALEQIAEAERAGVAPGPADRQFLLAEARREAKRWPPPVLSKEWFDAMDATPDGDAFWLWTVLKKLQPSLTLEQARALAPRVDRTQAVRLVAAAMGVEVDEGKAVAPATHAGPTASRTGGRSSTRSRPSTAGRSRKSAG